MPVLSNGPNPDVQTDSPCSLQERLDEAGLGDFVSAEAIEEWVGSWFGPDELPPPDADLRQIA